MNDTSDPGRRLYKARRPDGEVAWVDHDELWRLQQGQAEELRRKQARRRRLALAALAGLLALAVVLVAYRLRPPAAAPSRSADAPAPAAGEPGAVATPAAADTRVVPPIPAAADAPVAAPTAAAADTPVAPPAAASAPPLPEAAADPPPSPEDRVAGFVTAWAAAWARQDVPAYLASYGAEFEPAEGLARPGWERLRRQRLLEPPSIRVEIEELEIVLGDAGRAEARFRQTYTSPGYSDVVRKTLELVEEGDGWRIIAERAAAP